MNPYPTAERLPLLESLHGHAVADPYRWLEDPEDPRTPRFLAAQDALTGPALAALPGRDELGARLRELVDVGAVSVPVWRAGRRFTVRRDPGQEHGVLVVVEPDGTERVLLDPGALDPTGLTTLDAWSPSREGTRLAYQLSVGGDEESRLHVLDVDTRAPLQDPVDRCRYSPVAWLPGGDSYVYVRRLPPQDVPPGEQQLHRRVYRHTVGADPVTDTLISAEGMYDDPTFYFGVRVSADGAWLVVDGSPGTAPRDSVWIADLAGGGELVPVLTQQDAVRATAWVEQGRLLVRTTDGAPRWRLCATDPRTPGREHWRELVAEDPGSVLEGLRLLRDGRMVLARSRHAVGELHLHAVDGTALTELALPGPGALSGLSVVDLLTPDHPDEVWVGWTDFVTPTEVHRVNTRTATTERVAAAPGAGDRPGLHTQQISCSSADGQTVRMFLLSAGPEPDGPRPTLLTGYGGFALSREPGYAASALAWVQAGGVWALASLRGGGEEGEAWHRAGMREHKQNVFDDFHAAAEAEELGWLLGYSPYHRVVEGSAYPATLVTVFDSDTRVDPVHGYKLVAALQHATAGEGPVLLRRETDVGHGARSVSRSVALTVDQLAFLAAHTGLDVAGGLSGS